MSFCSFFFWKAVRIILFRVRIDFRVAMDAVNRNVYWSSLLNDDVRVWNLVIFLCKSGRCYSRWKLSKWLWSFKLTFIHHDFSNFLQRNYHWHTVLDIPFCWLLHKSKRCCDSSKFFRLTRELFAGFLDFGKAHKDSKSRSWSLFHSLQQHKL